MEYLFFLFLIFTIFIIISVVNYSEKNPKLRELTFIFIGLFALMFFIFGILILIPSLTKIKIINFSHLGFGLIISSIVCFLLLMRNVRKRVIELLRLDMNPDSAIHAFGMVLFFTSLIISTSIFFMASTTPEDLKKIGFDMRNINLTPFDVVANETAYLILALIACGFLTRRNLKEILIRLGVVKPKFKEVIIGLIAGLMLILAAEIIALLFTQLFGLPEAENLDTLKNLMTLEGAFVVGLSSGICEEILFRGALQPKFGILLTSILFALLHFQYSSTMLLSLLVIFILSIFLGYLKNKTNTTTTMIAHASFNTVQILIALLVIGSS